MQRLIFISIITTASALVLPSTTAATLRPAEAMRVRAAADVVRSIADTVSADSWQKARCVVVVPNLRKTAFIVGGEYGKGVMTCRSSQGWGAPVFMQVAKGSSGIQLGAEQIDLVLLVMNERGVQKLLEKSVTLGVDASIAAGPLGLRAEAGVDPSSS